MAVTPLMDAKLRDARQLYNEVYKADASFVAIAPGRVNMIGEHIDHQGYSVLPAALNQSIEVAIGPGNGDAMLEICHKAPAVFPPVTFKTLEDIKIATPPHWSNYIVASLFGLLEYGTFDNDVTKVGTGVKRLCPLQGSLLTAAKKIYPSHGLRLCMDGRVPLAAGVSSSSAAVVASTLALAYTLNMNMTRETVASICANSERHVGTAGGGMDQAAICLSKQGMARLIHFHPLHTEAVPLPQNGVLVICNSGREAPKAVQAATCYNKRVFELKLACYMIQRAEFPHEDIPKEKIPTLTLREVQERLGVSLLQALECAKKHIPAGRMSKRTAESILGLEKREYLVNSRVGPAVWERNVYFEPLARVIHVYTEAQRVLDFVKVCRDTNQPEEANLIALGRLLNQSNESLALEFDCSCPELDEVTTLACKLGAYGSRLTGAGWGGCTVSLVHKNRVPEFLEGMKSYFYRKDRLVAVDVPEPLERGLFIVVPGDGAHIFTGDGKKLLWE